MKKKTSLSTRKSALRHNSVSNYLYMLLQDFRGQMNIKKWQIEELEMLLQSYFDYRQMEWALKELQSIKAVIKEERQIPGVLIDQFFSVLEGLILCCDYYKAHSFGELDQLVQKEMNNDFMLFSERIPTITAQERRSYC